MERESFAKFVEQTLEEVISLAEEKVSKKLPRRFAFQWLGKAKPRITEDVVEYIVQRVYIDSDHIYPCVDIGVADLLEDGSLLIVANVAGYPATTFRRNWTGRDGPFVHIVGSPLIERISGHPSQWTPEAGSFNFTIPDMKKLASTSGQELQTPKRPSFWKAIAQKFR
jgi:hypothetical protein